MRLFALLALLVVACGGGGGAVDAATPDAARADASTMGDAGDAGTMGDAGTIGGSGDGTGDILVPWAGGPAYYAPFAHGPATDASFFPLTVWLQSPRNAARYAAIGIDMYVGQFDDPTAADLATLSAATMPVACSQDSATLPLAGDPTIVMWTQEDEPDNAQPIAGGGYGPCVTPSALMDVYDHLRAADATRPVFLNFGQGVANTDYIGRGSACHSDLAYYGTAAHAGDVISFDIYPMNATDPAVAAQPWLVPLGVDRLRTWAADAKPVWVWIETTRIDTGDGPGPTPAETRAEVWMALVHGAMGIGYFAHRITPFDETGLLDDPAMSAAVGALNAQLHALAPVLNTQSVANAVTVTSSAPAVPVDVMAKRSGGALYVFAVQMRDGPTTATFAIRGAPAAGTVDVVGESRTLPIVAGSFHDDFASWGAHVYRAVY